MVHFGPIPVRFYMLCVCSCCRIYKCDSSSPQKHLVMWIQDGMTPTHRSECCTTCALIIESNAAASLWSTVPIYPRTRKWLVSTQSKTYFFGFWSSLWCYKMNSYYINISDITLETLYIPLVYDGRGTHWFVQPHRYQELLTPAAATTLLYRSPSATDIYLL